MPVCVDGYLLPPKGKAEAVERTKSFMFNHRFAFEITV